MTLRDQDKRSRLSLFAKHAAKYYAVGASGVLVNLGLLYYLTEYVGLWYFLSYALAISVSITSNFVLNKFWTFIDSIDSQRIIVMYVKFVSVSMLGMAVQLGSIYVLVESLTIYYMLAALISICIAGAINFIINRRWTFGVKF
ncbi:MAG: dolichol-phosphate mannosyltransferase [Thaumarchaeota archaeon CSP1-1]|jgi:dolichol-phosphate mannosyltransferase|nr:MAG: dolichol-phosphate mannosyltransferase [Thaumarchaeota archaeon CSP1-1]